MIRQHNAAVVECEIEIDLGIHVQNYGALQYGGKAGEFRQIAPENQGDTAIHAQLAVITGQAHELIIRKDAGLWFRALPGCPI